MAIGEAYKDYSKEDRCGLAIAALGSAWKVGGGRTGYVCFVHWDELNPKCGIDVNKCGKGMWRCDIQFAAVRKNN